MNYRNLRVAKLIKEELGKILLREVEFGNSILVTIAEVEVFKDLSQARIKLGVIPPAASKEVIDLVNKQRPLLQNLLMKKINIKPMPRIIFENIEADTRG